MGDARSQLIIVATGMMLGIISLFLDPSYAMWLVLPDLFGLSDAAIGVLSIGVLYTFVGVVCYFDIIQWKRGRIHALAVGIVSFPVLMIVYWIAAQSTTLFGEVYSLETFVSEAFTYLPIALGLAMAFATDHREQFVLVGVAVISVAIPFLLILPVAVESGGLVGFFPIAIVVILIFDGIVAYPLYRLGTAEGGE